MAATAEALINTLAGGSDAGAEPAAETAVVEAVGEPMEPSEAPANDIRAVESGAPPDGGPAAKPTPEQLYQQSMAANREVRSENKALKAQVQELTAKIEALSKPPAAAVEPPPEPDFLADPKAYVDDAKAKLKQLTDQIEADKKQQTEAQRQQEESRETWNKIVAADAEFAAATPDYYDALNHVRAIRAEQIKIEVRETLDRDATDQEVAQILAAQEAQGAAQLIAKGKNPSKFYYEYAKTFGYKPKAATSQGTPSATPATKPDKEAVRTMGSGGAADSTGDDDGPTDSPLGGLLAAAQNEHKAQFKRRK